ncbi:MAG TPA: L,D-transpeptidase [Rhizomicrobium sp.]
MSPLRVLGFCYIATASLFVLALASADQARLHAVLDGAGATVSRRFDTTLWRSFREFAHGMDARFFHPPQPQATLELMPPAPGEERTYAHATLAPITSKRLIDQESADEKLADLPPLLTIAPDLPALEEQEPAAPDEKTAAQNGVQARLERNLTTELRDNFDLFLFISKASKGPAGQRLYVFKKDAGDKLAIVFDWSASTGREANEVSPQGRQVFTATPSGLYQFDPVRLYRNYFSRAWNGEMPFAMFFDWVRHGAKTGVAVHAATGAGIAKLGERTSAGCIHLSPKHAALLFKLIRSDYRGQVPRFAYDAESRTSSNKGELMRDEAGRPVMMDGYRVLIDVEDYSGADILAVVQRQTEKARD